MTGQMLTQNPSLLLGAGRGLCDQLDGRQAAALQFHWDCPPYYRLDEGTWTTETQPLLRAPNANPSLGCGRSTSAEAQPRLGSSCGTTSSPTSGPSPTPQGALSRAKRLRRTTMRANRQTPSPSVQIRPGRKAPGNRNKHFRRARAPSRCPRCPREPSPSQATRVPRSRPLHRR